MPIIEYKFKPKRQRVSLSNVFRHRIDYSIKNKISVELGSESLTAKLLYKLYNRRDNVRLTQLETVCGPAEAMQAITLYRLPQNFRVQNLQYILGSVLGRINTLLKIDLITQLPPESQFEAG